MNRRVMWTLAFLVLPSCGQHPVPPQITAQLLAQWRLTGPGRTGFRLEVDSSNAVDGRQSLALRAGSGLADSVWAASEGVIGIGPLQGGHVRITAFLRTQNAGGASLWARVDGELNGSYVRWGHAATPEPEVTATTGWERYELVLPAPEGARMLVLGTILHGAGTVWLDDITLEQVGTDVPLTNPVAMLDQGVPYREPPHLQAFLSKVSFEDS